MPTIETLSIPNFLLSNVLAEGELSADISPNTAVAPLLNASDMSANDYTVLVPGDETAELRQIQSISAQSLTVTSNYLLKHKNHESIIKIFGNQIKIYRAPNVDDTAPADSAFTALGTIYIDPTTPMSMYTDAAGGAGFWYKFTYKNEFTGAETDLSLAEAIRGGGFGHYVSIEEIRDEGGVAALKSVDASIIAGRRDEAESEIKGGLAAAGYIMPLQTGNGTPYTSPSVRNIARLLSAGLVMQKNFGLTHAGSSKNGQDKLKQAREMLASVQKKKIILLDILEKPLAQIMQASGYPDENAAANNEDSQVSINKIF